MVLVLGFYIINNYKNITNKTQRYLLRSLILALSYHAFNLTINVTHKINPELWRINYQLL